MLPTVRKIKKSDRAHDFPRINTEQGFTLVEILIALFIVGILSAIALTSYLSIVQRAKSCRNYLCIGLDPIQKGCATEIKTIASTGFQGTTIEVRYSAKCDASWARKTGPFISGSSDYVENREGQRYGQALVRDGYIQHYSDMGPGKELRACIELPSGETGCTDFPN